jgi:acetyl esterase/lipase
VKQHHDHLTADDRVADMLSHPALAEFARLMLPWDDRSVPDIKLRGLAKLMPYHSHVDADVVVAALDQLVDGANAGEPVFYDVYSDREKHADPTKRATGLFFFRGKPGAPFALIAPGGGFEYVASLHEGFPYAAKIAERGFNAFVLKYRVGHGGAPATEDMAAALSLIVRRASELNIDPRHFSLWGSSAGARMAALIGSHGAAQFGGDELVKPAAVVMAYTGHADHAADEPPTFAVVGTRDSIARPAVMERRIGVLKRQGTHAELHVVPGLEHGFGLGTGTVADGWIDRAIEFWKRSIAGRAA